MISKNSKIKVLITGGAGFIGSHIVDFLIKKKYKVIVVDNLSSGQKEFINEKAAFYEQDITKRLDEIFEKERPDIVIHTAAQIMLRESLKNPIYDAKTNIIGTINILETSRKYGVKKFIYTSTGGARVGEPEYLPVDENHPLKPCSPYGISKHTAEHYVWLYNKLYGIDYLIFCFGNVYGPRDNPICKRVIPLFVDLMLKQETPIIFGDGEQSRDFLYVMDLAEFIVNSIEKSPKDKLFHLANSEKIKVNEIFRLLKEISGFKGEVKHVKAIKGEVRDIVLNTRLAAKELGWKPKHSFKEGLKESFEWLKENRKLFESK